MKVKCANGHIMWETTERYDPEVTPHGGMVRLLDKWKTLGWPVFGDDITIATAGTPASEMDCPECLAPLVIGGRLLVIPDPEVEEAEVEETEEVVEEAEPVEEPAPKRKRGKR